MQISKAFAFCNRLLDQHDNIYQTVKWPSREEQIEILKKKFPQPLPTNIVVKNKHTQGSTINFTVEDVKEAINSLKCGKATGFDAIKNEYLKFASEKSSSFIHTLQNLYNTLINKPE